MDEMIKVHREVSPTTRYFHIGGGADLNTPKTMEFTKTMIEHLLSYDLTLLIWEDSYLSIESTESKAYLAKRTLPAIRSQPSSSKKVPFSSAFAVAPYKCKF